MPEVDIIRKAIFTVDHAESDDYGNLTVIDKEGKPHKVNAKHKDLHPVFVPDMAVEVGYGEYMHKEYIHTARQVKDGLSAPVVSKGNPDSIFPTPKTTPTKPAPFFDDVTIRDKALGHSLNWCIAKNQIENKLTYQDVLTVASVFEAYIKSGITTEKKN